MLTLNDGRSELWQWDTGRKLTVDADCSQIHFSNKVFGRSIDVDVVDGVAIIPDVLLQTDKDLNVWAFVGTAENGYTKISKTFKVNRRNKPADYVFTPPDQTTLGELVERLGKIEESQDPDAIKNAVDDYLANNPIMVKETDPTVPEWAKYPTKPSYTAAEVGAQPAGNYLTEIEIKPVIEAANSAQALAKQADKKVDTLREVVSKFHSNIVEEEKGDIITLDDASDMELAGLTLYGKTIQNGTPTPEAPIPLESVGDDGNVTVTVCGKNLISFDELRGLNSTTYSNGVIDNQNVITINTSTSASPNMATVATKWMKVSMDGTYTFSAYVYAPKAASCRIAIMDNSYRNIATTDSATFTGWKRISTHGLLSKDVTLSFVIQVHRGAGDVDVSFNRCMVEYGNSVTEYEPYKEAQTLTALTPNGLPGIPVTSGGNYTDENGQQWICDEIDFSRGRYVQRIGTSAGKIWSKSNTAAGSSGERYMIADENRKAELYCKVLCTNYQQANYTTYGVEGDFIATDEFNKINIRCADKLFGSANAFNEWVNNVGMVVLYPMENPIETDLSAEEIAQYSALHTNYPNTTVYNDEGAGMAVKYIADTKLYIDNKFAELASAIVNNT